MPLQTWLEIQFSDSSFRDRVVVNTRLLTKQTVASSIPARDRNSPWGCQTGKQPAVKTHIFQLWRLPAVKSYCHMVLLVVFDNLILKL